MEKHIQCKRVVAKGAMKRIGDGKIVDVWNDKWLLDTENGMFKTEKPINCKVEIIDRLISNGKWNMKLLKEIFCQEDVE